MDINRMFELLQSDSQVEFIKEFDKFGAEVYINPNIQKAIEIQIDRIYLGKIESIIVARHWLESLFLTCLSKQSFLSNIYFEKVVESFIKIEQGTNTDNCKKYAKHFPNNPICKPFLIVEKQQDNVVEQSNIVHFEPKFKKNETADDEKKSITLKKQMKIHILEKLASQRKRTTIAILYDMTKIMNTYYSEELFYECLKSLKKNKKVIFADMSDIYSEIRLPNKF